METFDDLANCWQQHSAAKIDSSTFANTIQTRMKTEKKGFAAYLLSALTYQVLIYAFGSYLTIRYHEDPIIAPLALAGTLLYIPFTILMMRRIARLLGSRPAPDQPLRKYITHQYQTLKSFYSFKKIFDAISIPILALIMSAVIHQLYVPGGVSDHRLGFAVVCMTWLCCCAVAAWFENRKHFRNPLERLNSILGELSEN